MRMLYLLWVCGSVAAQSGIGIDTSLPQQALHIGSTNGSIMIEGLNHVNNSFNGGDANSDFDLSNDLYPLYVDNNGQLTLDEKVYNISEEFDELDDSAITTNSVLLNSSDSDGLETTQITTYSITVSRETIIEVKYNISFDIYYDNSYTIISDNLARRVFTYITVTGDTQEYGRSSRAYTSDSTSSTGSGLYTNGSTYIILPNPGTYDIILNGGVSSEIKGGGGGSTSQNTYVEFATANDSMYLKLR